MTYKKTSRERGETQVCVFEIQWFVEITAGEIIVKSPYKLRHAMRV